MDHDFWLQRWREGRIGFHQQDISPQLRQHWPALGLVAASRVFVPLAGKSSDLLWLAGLGHRVLGVELSPLAVEQFFADNGLEPVVHASGIGQHYVAGPIELICGDAFALDAAQLADCDAVYDRAALVALPAEMRKSYAQELYARLPAACQGLLIALEHPGPMRAGPPFSVDETQMRQLFEPAWRVDRLERCRAIGADQAATTVYRLQHLEAGQGG